MNDDAKMTCPESGGPDNFTGIVLAGGKARRMGGRDKLSIEVAGVPMIRRVVNMMEKIFPSVIVAEGVAGKIAGLEGVKMVPDHSSDQGPLAGILAGLELCDTDWAFVVAGDMPALDQDLIMRIVSFAGDNVNAVVPVCKGLSEPLHAAFRTSTTLVIREMLASDRRKVLDLFDLIPTHFLEIAEKDLRALRNVNTPEQLEQARSMIK